MKLRSLEVALGSGFRVGPWLVEPGLNTISGKGATHHVEPKVMEVLVCLTRHPGESLPKEKLLQEVWPDTFVTDDALTRCIFELRRVFEDEAKEPRIIQTIPKRGYRLIAPVTAVKEVAEQWRAESGQITAAKIRKSRIALLAVLAIALVFVLLGTFQVVDSRNRLTRKGIPEIHSLAVLPLRNLSPDPSQEYFSDGMTDALITDLAQISSLKVISHTSTMQYKDAKKPLPEIARELNVDGIIEGTAQRSGEQIRINVQLIHGPSDKHIWANSYEREMRDVFALEHDVTSDIARQVQARLTAPDHGSPAQSRPVDPKVLEAYLQANYHLSRYGEGLGEEELKKAAQSFQQAIDADPSFAPAYNGLSSAHQQLLRGSSEDAAIARRAAEKAVELDPNYSDAHVSLGFVKWQPYLDWRGAEEELKKAIALNPNNAMARSTLSGLLMGLGRVEEGLRECKLAQELDPNQDNSGECLFHARDYDGSIAVLRLMLQRDAKNGFLHCYLFGPYFKKGLEKEAIDELAECYSLFGFSEIAAHMRHALEISGSRGAIREWAKSLEQLQATHQVYVPGTLATAYTILGDKDRAFYWLEQAYEHREMVSADGGVFFLRSEPMYDPLRSDPRFKDLLRRVGLPL